jgi:hypothetical protein
MALTAFEIEESIHVGAAPEIVWRFLGDPRSWPLWWPGCREAVTRDRKTLHDGSALTLALRLGWLAVKIDARVHTVTPQRTLLWEGQGAGVTGRHAFYLDAKPNGTFVRQRESFSGPGVLLFRLARLDVLTRKMFQKNLKGLKRIAERAS